MLERPLFEAPRAYHKFSVQLWIFVGVGLSLGLGRGNSVPGHPLPLIQEHLTVPLETHERDGLARISNHRGVSVLQAHAVDETLDRSPRGKDEGPEHVQPQQLARSTKLYIVKSCG